MCIYKYLYVYKYIYIYVYYVICTSPSSLPVVIFRLVVALAATSLVVPSPRMLAVVQDFANPSGKMKCGACKKVLVGVFSKKCVICTVCMVMFHRNCEPVIACTGTMGPHELGNKALAVAVDDKKRLSPSCDHASALSASFTAALLAGILEPILLYPNKQKFVVAYT